jgi:hypothetical protein
VDEPRDLFGEPLVRGAGGGTRMMSTQPAWRLMSWGCLRPLTLMSHLFPA